MGWDFIPEKINYSRMQCFRIHNTALEKIKSFFENKNERQTKFKPCPFCVGTDIAVWSWMSPYAVKHPRKNGIIYYPSHLKVFADICCKCRFGTSNGEFYVYAKPTDNTEKALNEAYKTAREKAEQLAVKA